MISVKDRTADSLRSFQKKTTIAFISIVILLIAVFSVVILNNSSAMLNNKVSSLISANSRQIGLNVDNYMNKFITAGTLLFSNEEIYKFDVTDSNLDDYEISKRKTIIENRIFDIGIMENFSDFAIIYANDKSFGWLSNITQDMFLDGDSRYETFSKYLDKGNNSSGWAFGVKGNNSRVYYVKRINENTILVESFFSRELSNVFEISEQLEGMVVRLIDENNKIVYSSEKEEIGNSISEKTEALLSKSKGGSTYDSDNYIDVNYCENGWRVVCSVPTQVMLAENNTLIRTTIIFGIVLIIISFVAIRLTQKMLSQPISGVMTGLEKKASYDQLSGVLNKASFTDSVTKIIETTNANVVAMIMIDMDNFKQINDTLGHAYGDQVIKRMGTLVNANFGDRALVGRLGGDEFALFMSYKFLKLKIATESLESDMKSLKKRFAEEFKEEQEKCAISLSCGIYVNNYNREMSFEEIYKKADSALYISKTTGKNKYTFYSEEQ